MVRPSDNMPRLHHIYQVIAKKPKQQWKNSDCCLWCGVLYAQFFIRRWKKINKLYFAIIIVIIRSTWSLAAIFTARVPIIPSHHNPNFSSFLLFLFITLLRAIMNDRYGINGNIIIHTYIRRWWSWTIICKKKYSHKLTKLLFFFLLKKSLSCCSLLIIIICYRWWYFALAWHYLPVDRKNTALQTIFFSRLICACSIASLSIYFLLSSQIIRHALPNFYNKCPLYPRTSSLFILAKVMV